MLRYGKGLKRDIASSSIESVDESSSSSSSFLFGGDAPSARVIAGLAPISSVSSQARPQSSLSGLPQDADEGVDTGFSAPTDKVDRPQDTAVAGANGNGNAYYGYGKKASGKRSASDRDASNSREAAVDVKQPAAVTLFGGSSSVMQSSASSSSFPLRMSYSSSDESSTRRAKIDEVQYLLDGLGKSQPLPVRRSSALQLVTALKDKTTCSIARKNGTYGLLFESLQFRPSSVEHPRSAIEIVPAVEDKEDIIDAYDSYFGGTTTQSHAAAASTASRASAASSSGPDALHSAVDSETDAILKFAALVFMCLACKDIENAVHIKSDCLALLVEALQDPASAKEWQAAAASAAAAAPSVTSSKGGLAAGGSARSKRRRVDATAAAMDVKEEINMYSFLQILSREDFIGKAAVAAGVERGEPLHSIRAAEAVSGGFSIPQEKDIINMFDPVLALAHADDGESGSCSGFALVPSHLACLALTWACREPSFRARMCAAPQALATIIGLLHRDFLVLTDQDNRGLRRRRAKDDGEEEDKGDDDDDEGESGGMGTHVRGEVEFRFTSLMSILESLTTGNAAVQATFHGIAVTPRFSFPAAAAASSSPSSSTSSRSKNSPSPRKQAMSFQVVASSPRSSKRTSLSVIPCEQVSGDVSVTWLLMTMLRYWTVSLLLALEDVLPLDPPPPPSNAASAQPPTSSSSSSSSSSTSPLPSLASRRDQSHLTFVVSLCRILVNLTHKSEDGCAALANTVGRSALYELNAAAAVGGLGKGKEKGKGVGSTGGFTVPFSLSTPSPLPPKRERGSFSEKDKGGGPKARRALLALSSGNGSKGTAAASSAGQSQDVVGDASFQHQIEPPSSPPSPPAGVMARSLSSPAASAVASPAAFASASGSASGSTAMTFSLSYASFLSSFRAPRRTTGIAMIVDLLSLGIYVFSPLQSPCIPSLDIVTTCMGILINCAEQSQSCREELLACDAAVLVHTARSSAASSASTSFALASGNVDVQLLPAINFFVNVFVTNKQPTDVSSDSNEVSLSAGANDSFVMLGIAADMERKVLASYAAILLGCIAKFQANDNGTPFSPSQLKASTLSSSSASASASSSSFSSSGAITAKHLTAVATIDRLLCAPSLGLSLASLTGALKEFLILQSDGQMLTEETLESILEIVDFLEKVDKKKRLLAEEGIKLW